VLDFGFPQPATKRPTTTNDKKGNTFLIRIIFKYALGRTTKLTV
jgi:hypothetical protein